MASSSMTLEHVSRLNRETNYPPSSVKFTFVAEAANNGVPCVSSPVKNYPACDFGLVGGLHCLNALKLVVFSFCCRACELVKSYSLF